MSILPDYIEVSRCADCGLHKAATNVVLGEGPVDAKVVFIGEGPGQDEDRTGRPFVGRAGRVLEDLLRACQLKRSDVYITNVVKHRPPGNRVPTAPEIQACGQWLDREMAALDKARLVVCLGATAQGAFFPPKVAVGTLRSAHGRVYVGVYHPAYYLRAKRPAVMEQMVEGVRLGLKVAGLD